MTYTFKLARRLAVSRRLVVLIALALAAACSGDTTSPDPDPVASTAPVSLQVSPRSVTVEVGQRVQFRAHNRIGDRSDAGSTLIAWTATGGVIHTDGTFSSSVSGTFKVVGRGRGRKQSDTSTVVVVPPIVDLVRVEVTPGAVTLEPGAQRAFTATGYLSDSSTAPIGVNWSATGGAVDAGGVYTADSTAGAYRIIATNIAGTLADTAVVTIPAPPAPPSPPSATLAQVFVSPASLSLATGATGRFSVYGRDSNGDSVAVAVTFSATGGTITPDGLYTAGPNAGTFRVVATADSRADTSVVSLTKTLAGGTATGVFFGPYNLYGGGASGPSSWSTPLPGSDIYSMSMDFLAPAGVLERIASARERHLKLITTMTGGSHDRYKTNGVFDITKWTAVMDAYNTPTIKAAVAAAVADGTIIGNVVMDEPQNTSPDNSWGPAGTMTKSRVDQMCGYVKSIFPTLPAGVVHDHTVFQPDQNYAICDFIISQYRWAKTKGDIAAFRDGGLAWAKRSGVAIAFSLNILDGGIPTTVAGSCAYGVGTYGYNCRMSPTQVRDWGQALGTSACALTMWRYDSAFMSNPANVQAFKDVAATLAKAPARSCRRP